MIQCYVYSDFYLCRVHSLSLYRRRFTNYRECAECRVCMHRESESTDWLIGGLLPRRLSQFLYTMRRGVEEFFWIYINTTGLLV